MNDDGCQVSLCCLSSYDLFGYYWICQAFTSMLAFFYVCCQSYDYLPCLLRGAYDLGCFCYEYSVLAHYLMPFDVLIFTAMNMMCLCISWCHLLFKYTCTCHIAMFEILRCSPHVCMFWWNLVYVVCHIHARYRCSSLTPLHSVNNDMQ